MKGDKKKLAELTLEQLESKITELNLEISKQQATKTNSKKTHLNKNLRKQLSRAHNYKHFKKNQNQ